MAALLRKKYIKQTIFIIGFILFLLSLFEWTGFDNFSARVEAANTEQHILNSLSAKAVSSNYKAKNLLNKKIQYHPEPRFNSSLYTKKIFPSPVKRYLLIRNLRI